VIRAGVAAALALVLAAAALGTPAGSGAVAKGKGTPPGSDWLVGGDRPQDYRVELEPSGGRLATAAALIRSGVTEPRGFVSLMRHVSAAPYRNGHVRLRAWLKTEGVAGRAGLWMRVDQHDDPVKVLAFDNMGNRPVRGTTGWRRYEVVLDVPPGADEVYYGALLEGAGRLWVDEVTLEPAGKDVPVTAKSRMPWQPPSNLDFDHPPGAKRPRTSKPPPAAEGEPP